MYLFQEKSVFIKVFSLMELILIVKSLAGTVPSSAPPSHQWVGARPLPLCSYARYAPECTLYTVQYTVQLLVQCVRVITRTRYTPSTITDKDNNEYANE